MTLTSLLLFPISWLAKGASPFYHVESWKLRRTPHIDLSAMQEQSLMVRFTRLRVWLREPRHSNNSDSNLGGASVVTE
ncbi:hypothetical protein LZ31DRAFT_550628 [Colletotrichum somersetense]|nr:hypothetical protein LZ31DRAFT_550628 [Colletotrichum somersetense]